MVAPVMALMYGLDAYYMRVEVTSSSLKVSNFHGKATYSWAEVASVEAVAVVSTDSRGRQKAVPKLTVTKSDGSKRDFDLAWAEPEDYLRVAQLCRAYVGKPKTK